MDLKTRRISKASLLRLYAIAFLVLTLTISSSYFLSDWIVRKQDQYASVINISGRQRMLSQRITGLMNQAFLQTDVAERNAWISLIDDSIELMSISHALLMGRGAENVETVMSDAISVIYFEPTMGLDQRVNAFLTEAVELRNIAAEGESVDRRRLAMFSDASFGELLTQLNDAVDQYQNDAEAELNLLRRLNLGLWILTLGVLLAEILLIFMPLARRLDEAQKELENIAFTDPLTGSWNRRRLLETGELLWSIAKRHSRPLSVVMCDFDHFKKINDAYGHGVGDEALKEFVRICLKTIRQHDILGRFGGEEFVIILPNTNEKGNHPVGTACRISA